MGSEMCIRDRVTALILSLGIFSAILAGSSWWEHAFSVVLASLSGLYLAISLIAAFLVARQNAWRFFPVLPFVFATYQISYAVGFLLALAYRPMAWDQPSYLRKILTAITR